MTYSPLFKEDKPHFHTSGGQLAVGFKIYTYAAGTDTPVSMYSDPSGSTQYQNPIVLDSRGEPSGQGIYADPSRLYKVVLKTPADAVVWSMDNVSTVGGSGGEESLMVVHIGSIPGVGPWADKSYSEMLAALDAGKSIIAVDSNRWEFVVYKVDTSSGYIDFIRPGVSEIDGTGVGNLPDAMTNGLRIHSNGNIEGIKKYTIGKRYWRKDPVELEPQDMGSFGPTNNTSSTAIITSFDISYSTVLNITFLDPYPNGSANADLLLEIQSGALTDIKVNFWNYGMPYGQEHELAAPANLSSVLANGAGRYGIRATGEFWTIDWLGALS